MIRTRAILVAIVTAVTPCAGALADPFASLHGFAPPAGHAASSSRGGWLVVAVFGCACSYAHVNSGEVGIVRTPTGMSKETLQTGDWQIGYYDDATVYSTRSQDRAEQLEVLAADGLKVVLDASVRYHIVPGEVLALDQELGSAGRSAGTCLSLQLGGAAATRTLWLRRAATASRPRTASASGCGPSTTRSRSSTCSAGHRRPHANIGPRLTTVAYPARFKADAAIALRVPLAQ